MIALRFAPAETPVAPPPAIFVDLNSPPAAAPIAPQAQDVDRGQIVESETVADQSSPKDAKFLGEKNQTVAEETKARKVDVFREGGRASQAGNRGQGLSFKDLAPAKPITPPTAREMEGFRQQEQRQMAQADSGRPGDSQDNPGSANNDFLKDVKDGDRTMLSTKEFVYFGYYRRIRQRLEVAWNTRLRSTLDGYVYGGRALATNKDYVTGIVVVLDRTGNITRVQVMQQSGARDLDQAAVDAFNQAGPFPDPPSGLVDDQGEIQIPWNFVLQSSLAGPLRHLGAS